jgi:hypothetical protein
MSTSIPQERAPAGQSAVEDDHMAGLTRRAALTGAAATTAIVTIGIDAPAFAQGADPAVDMDPFLTLSAALTGIAKAKLAPNVDPVGVGRQHFDLVNSKQASAFVRLLKIAKDVNLQVPPSPPPPSPPGNGIIRQENVDKLVKQIEQGGDDVKYLARSIVLMWLLGSWYEPNELKRLTTPTDNPFVSHEVVSPAAYTAGWVWRIAQAHPMGYSDMQFGYWTHPPQPVADFIEVRNPKGGS